MINYETILSLFDDKLTLLEYLTKIEQALRNEKLTDITVTQTDASHVYFTFVFEDGSTIDTPTFTLPQGEQGEQGIQGVSVTNAEIDASGHLILTLSNGNTIDAGATGLQTVTASDVDSETATQYDILKADGNGGASWGKATIANISPENATQGYVLKAGLYDSCVWGKVGNASITTNNATQGYVLTAGADSSATWEAIPAQTPEGTAIKSTGETSGKVLTANGSGGASWQNGGTPLNKYRQTGLTRTKIFNIIRNAKGRVMVLAAFSYSGNISGTINNIPINIVDDETTNKTYLNFTTIATINSVDYIVTTNVEAEGGSASTKSSFTKLTDGSIISASVTINYSNFIVTYWNDTDLSL